MAAVFAAVLAVTAAGCGDDSSQQAAVDAAAADTAVAGATDASVADAASASDASETGPDATDAAADEPDLDPLVQVLGGEHRIHLDDQVVDVAVTDGRGALGDGRRVVLPADGDVPSVPVLSVRAGAVPIDPPRVDLPVLGGDAGGAAMWFREAVIDGRIVAVGVVDGGVEARVQAAPDLTVARPGAALGRFEQRWAPRPGGWQASSDGPVTRVARQAVAASGVPWAPGDTLLCPQPPGERGTTIACHEMTSDGPGQVALLFVDDDLGYGTAVGRDVLLTGVQVAREVGDDARCADVRALAEVETGFLRPVVPFAAIAYWFHQGQPARMDASGQGRPCATVWSDAVEFLHGGVDGRIVDTYQAAIEASVD